MLIGAVLGVVVSFVISRWWTNRQQEKERLHGIDVNLSKIIFPETNQPSQKKARKKKTVKK
jgi:hypothetical protein